MKRAIFVVMAILAIFAIVSCDNGTTKTTEKVTITFNAGEGGTVSPATKQVDKGAKAGDLPVATKTDFTNTGWATTAGATTANFTKDTVVSANIEVFAVWTGGSVVPGEPVTVDGYTLGAYTWENKDNDNQKGWTSNGFDGTSGLRWDTLKDAKYLVVKSKGGGANSNGFGGLYIVLQGDGVNWGQTGMYGDWVSFEHTADDVIYFAIKLDTLDSYSTLIAGSKGRIIVAMYPLSGLGLQDAYLVMGDIEKPEDSVDMGTHGFITKDLIVTPQTLPPPDAGPDLARAEKVSAANNWHPIYRFELPAGKTWADYKGLSASYMFEAEDLATARSRNARLIGTYEPGDFALYTGSGDAEGLSFMMVSLNSQVNGHYIDNGKLANSETAGSLVTELASKVGINAVGGEWFTYDFYDITGTNKNGNLDYYPADDYSGVLYFAIGLPGAGANNPPNIYSVKDVTLIGYSDADNVVATPAYFTNDGKLYPAFLGYPTTSGGDGFATASRAPLK